MLSTYLDYQLIARDFTKAIDRVGKQPVIDRETTYYRENIGKVKTIEEFVKNDRLFKYAMKAHGLEDMAYAKAFMVKVLKEGVQNPDSFANKLTDKRYAEFATAYNFERYGEKATTFNRATSDAPTNFASQVALASLQQGFPYVEDQVGYFVANIGDVASIDDLLADSRLLTVALGAFGLDATVEPIELVREMLEGGISDPNSPANTPADKRYANFVTAFNFVEFGSGTVARAEVKSAPSMFVFNTGLDVVRASPEFIKGETDYYKARIGKVTTIDQLMADSRLLRVAMAAYGLDSDAESPRDIKRMLQGGVSDPNSPANLLTDKRYASFVAAFNFVEHGAATTTRPEVLTETLDLYTTKYEAGVGPASKYFIAAETDYYMANVVKLDSIDDLMADTRLLSYALAAYGIDPATQSPATVRAMLEGGVSDPESPANKLTDKSYVAFVTAFNFAEYGEDTTTRTPAMEPAVGKFLRQTLEEDAGKTNEGVRLALYFERKAGALTSAYEILADTALSKVVRTALGIPESMATADIDKQAAMIEKKLDILDLQDPEKLADFVQRFTSMWEISNPSSNAQASISVLFAQPAEYGVSTDLLLSIQQMRS